MRPALVDLSAQAEAIRAENEPFALRVAPVAQASAPAAAVVGETIPLSAATERVGAGNCDLGVRVVMSGE